jgi:putative membrane protein
MKTFINWIIASVAVGLTAYLLPGIHVGSFLAALATAVVLGLVNAVLRPILIILTLPINIITLGLFTLVINALLIQLTAAVVPGFTVDGFWWAVAFSIVLFLINSILLRRRERHV